MKHSLLTITMLICTILLMCSCAESDSTDSQEISNQDEQPSVVIITPNAEPDGRYDPESDDSYDPEPDDRNDPEPATEPSTNLLDAMSAFSEITAAQTAAMSCWAEYGFGLVENDTYYGRFYLKGDQAPMLFSIKLKSQKYDVTAGKWQILDGEHSPKYLVKQGDVLYYVMLDRVSGKSLGIAKVSTGGDDLQVLYEGSCDYLSAAGEKLFFTDSNGRPASISTDGSDLQMIVDREAYYLFALNDDWLIFQDDADNESIHLFRISDCTDIKLNDEPSYHPVISGTSLFFSCPDADSPGAFRLACMDIGSYDEMLNDELNCYVPVFSVQYGDKLFGGEYYIFNGMIRFMNGSEPVKAESWKALEDDAYIGFTRVIRFVSDKWIVEDLTGKDAGITAIMFHDRSGGYASKIPWLDPS